MNSSDSSSSSSRDLELIAQLRQSLGMLQVAFDAASEAMVIVDVDRIIHWANQASADLFVGGVPIQLVNQTLADVSEAEALGCPCQGSPSVAGPPTSFAADLWREPLPGAVPPWAMNPRCSCCVGGLWN